MAVKITVPSPREVGLPEQFDKWRPNQAEAIQSLLNPTTRVNAIEAPTGFGKQNVAVGAALLSGDPTCIVTANRGLQDQYYETYKDVGMVDIRGRSNYNCDLRDDYTCDDGYLARCPYKGTVGCPASKAEIMAASSNLVVTNYDKWTSSRKFSSGMSHFRRVIFDEGHAAPDALARAMRVTLGFREMEKDLKMTFPDSPENQWFSSWKLWARDAKPRAEELMQEAYDRIEGATEPKPTWVRHYNHLKNLHRRLSILATANSSDWIVDEKEEGFEFDPLRPAKYSEMALLLKVPHVGVISATLRPRTLFMIGVGSHDFTYTEYPSDFDPKDCPIYYVPTMAVSYDVKDLSRMWLLLDQIAARRAHQKGIVHTVSYGRRDDLMQHISFLDRTIINPRGEAPTRMVEEFKESLPGTVFISPSVGTGFDFPGRECEWQFVAKLPYPPPSKINRAREEDDEEYRPYMTMQALVQAFGRGARFKGDRCQNFIGDMQMKWFKPRYGHLAPKWFHGFYKQVEILPPPLEAMI